MDVALLEIVNSSLHRSGRSAQSERRNLGDSHPSSNRDDKSSLLVLPTYRENDAPHIVIPLGTESSPVDHRCHLPVLDLSIYPISYSSSFEDCLSCVCLCGTRLI